LPIVLVGASAAGVSAARTLRAEGCVEPILLIDADAHLPYERPPLSKRMLADPTASAADFPLLTPSEAATLDIRLHLGQRVAAISPAALTVTLADGETIPARAILLAVGGSANRLALPGSSLPGIHVIRTLADAQALRSDLAGAEQVAVIGGGLIGMEAAAAIAGTGRSVCLLDAAEPLAHSFAAPIAQALRASHAAAGVRIMAHARIAGFRATDGRVSGIELAGGEIVPAQVVVIGVGMRPDDSLARAAGLAVSAGIHVDPAQRTTAPGIFAAGDVASFAESGAARKRHDHWQAAEQQGANAARTILGQPAQPSPVPWFWSDQGVHHVEMAGRRSADSVVRQTPRGLSVFELEDGRLVGVASIDDPMTVRIGMRMIQSARAVDRRALSDPEQDLRALLRA
jgi:3-phenylpropionate/trans-cinnamate dioxygenase ferredoxin reductase subunit